GALLAFRLDRERFGLIWWLFWQRFVYRQLMYGVVWKALLTAANGWRAGWGKLDRKGTVHLPSLHLGGAGRPSPQPSTDEPQPARGS
ncbi:MAG TPA: hypothetical protein VFU47_01805, partial [Armatimonadota bacterium]|nr:hypothetical protein [Armatimonadota bacterium]